MAKKSRKEILKKDVNLVKKSLSILNDKFAYNGPIDLPLEIILQDSSESDRGEGYRHTVTYTFLSHYVNEKVDYFYSYNARTDEREDLAKELVNIIYDAIINEFKDRSYFDKFLFVKEGIKGGYRIIITKKDGS